MRERGAEKNLRHAKISHHAAGDEKLLTKCHHESTGPPLKSFLFDLPASVPKHDAYAAQTLRAIAHVKDTFPGLR